MAIPLVTGGKAAGDFEQQMRMISTMLDEPAKYMDRFTASIKSMSIEFGEGTDTLAKGLYDILSASIAPEQAMIVLRQAMIAAKGGMTDAATATKTLINLLNAYHVPAQNVADLSDLMFTTVKRGVTTFAELAESQGEVTATAAAAGLSLDELGAAIATMTRNGLKTDMAVTALTNMMKEFIKPTDGAIAAARKYGIELNSATLRTEGLYGVMKKLRGAGPEDIAKIFENIRGLRGAFAALGDIEGFATDLEYMRTRAGRAEESFKKMSGGILGWFKKLHQTATQIFVSIGDALAGLLKAVGPTLLIAGKLFADFIDRNQNLVRWVALAAIGLTTIGGALVTAGLGAKLVAFALEGVLLSLKALAVLTNPFVLLTATVAALGVGLMKLALGEYVPILTESAQVIGEAFAAMFEWLRTGWAGVVELATNAVDSISAAFGGNTISNAARDTVGAVSGAFVQLSSRLVEVGNWIAGGFSSLFADLSAGWENVSQDGVTAASTIAKALSAGDIEGAAKVVLAFIRLEWQRLISWLTGAWDGFRGFWIELGTGILIGINNVTAKLKSAWAEAIGFIEKMWDKWASSSFVESISKPIAWVIAKLQGLDVEDVQKNLREGFEYSRSQRPNRQAEIDAATQASKAEIEKNRAAWEADLGAGATARGADRQANLDQAQADLDAAKAEFNAAKAQVEATATSAVTSGRTPFGAPPPETTAALAGAGASKTAGAISSYAAMAMQGGSAEGTAQKSRQQMVAELRLIRKGAAFWEKMYQQNLELMRTT